MYSCACRNVMIGCDLYVHRPIGPIPIHRFDETLTKWVPLGQPLLHGREPYLYAVATKQGG